MPECAVWQFAGCFYRWVPDWDLGQTIFAPGIELNAAPDMQYFYKVAYFGYEDSYDGLRRMGREHDILHSWIAALYGLPYSPTLYTLAHCPCGNYDECAERDPVCIPVRVQHTEEILVRDFQRCLVSGVRSELLSYFEDFTRGKYGMSLAQTLAAARHFLDAGIISDTERAIPDKSGIMNYADIKLHNRDRNTRRVNLW